MTNNKTHDKPPAEENIDDEVEIDEKTRKLFTEVYVQFAKHFGLY
jgi:hypothetical protein